MAGATSTPSRSVASARDWVPALCAATEATWLSLALDTLVNGSPTPRAVSLPYVALAVPMTAAAVMATVLRRRVDPAWRRWLVLGPLVILGTILTAAAVAALSVPGVTGRVMTEPWSLGPIGDARFAGGAWLFALVAWGRGTWLGSVRIRLANTVVSLGVGAATFVLLIFVQHGTHERALRTAIGRPGVLLLVFLGGGTLALAALQRTGVEAKTRVTDPSGSTAGWLGMLVVPLVVVAGIGLLVAALLGPVAPEVGHGLATAVTRVGEAIGAALGWVWHLIAGRSHGTRPVTVHQRVVTSHHPEQPGLLAARVAVAVGVGALLLWQLRRLRPRLGWIRAHRLRLSRVRPEKEDRAGERRSWQFHLWPWLRGLAEGALARLRPGRATVVPVAGSQAPGDELSGVRRHYRTLLVALAAAGEGRAPGETVRELQRRLSAAVPDHDGDVELLSSLYEAARYSGRPAGPAAAEQAGTAATAVLEALRPPPLETGPPANRRSAGPPTRWRTPRP